MLYLYIFFIGYIVVPFIIKIRYKKFLKLVNMRQKYKLTLKLQTKYCEMFYFVYKMAVSVGGACYT